MTSNYLFYNFGLGSILEFFVICVKIIFLSSIIGKITVYVLSPLLFKLGTGIKNIGHHLNMRLVGN